MKKTFLSPAKVNLFLKVVSRRPDGYHDIVSLVTPISLYDVIHIRERDDGAVVVDDDKGVLPLGEENTIYRAVTLLKREYSLDRGVEVMVEKNIPIGAGLGGPSSDAATVLRALAGMWRLPVDERRLTELGTRVGADVPLFLYGRSCVIRGIGERVSPASLPHMWFVVIYPGMLMKAKDVYGGLKISLTKRENDIKLSANFETIQDVANILENDLESVGLTMLEDIRVIKERLTKMGAVGALMSGSGSSVFGIFENKEEALRAGRDLEDMGNVYVVHSA